MVDSGVGERDGQARCPRVGTTMAVSRYIQRIPLPTQFMRPSVIMMLGELVRVMYGKRQGKK
jgi:hypothetical protein